MYEVSYREGCVFTFDDRQARVSRATLTQIVVVFRIVKLKLGIIECRERCRVRPHQLHFDARVEARVAELLRVAAAPCQHIILSSQPRLCHNTAAVADGSLLLPHAGDKQN